MTVWKNSRQGTHQACQVLKDESCSSEQVQNQEGRVEVNSGEPAHLTLVPKTSLRSLRAACQDLGHHVLPEPRDAGVQLYPDGKWTPVFLQHASFTFFWHSHSDGCVTEQLSILEGYLARSLEQPGIEPPALD